MREAGRTYEVTVVDWATLIDYVTQTYWPRNNCKKNVQAPPVTNASQHEIEWFCGPFSLVGFTFHAIAHQVYAKVISALHPSWSLKEAKQHPQGANLIRKKVHSSAK